MPEPGRPREGVARLSLPWLSLRRSGEPPTVSERAMIRPQKVLFRLALVVIAGAGATGCVIGAPERAGYSQNLNAISDDISAVGMTQSDSLKISDPNLQTVYPHSYQVPHE
jgi:hypothetical protein